MLLYKTPSGAVLNDDGRWFDLEISDWNALLRRDDLHAALHRARESAAPRTAPVDLTQPLLPPMGTHEVWAAGVTYLRSRTARMEESHAAGGSNFYDRVYHAERPELFFKATASLVRCHRHTLLLRPDSSWIVPEPELTLLISHTGRITGYTAGNDLSCRDIEGENPLYLPQAKTFDRCAGLGPALFVTEEPLAPSTEIHLAIHQKGSVAFAGSTELSQMKKTLESLVHYLYRALHFPNGCFLMTGTGIVPPDDFTLTAGDEVHITIPPIGTLVNPVGP